MKFIILPLFYDTYFPSNTSYSQDHIHVLNLLNCNDFVPGISGLVCVFPTSVFPLLLTVLGCTLDWPNLLLCVATSDDVDIGTTVSDIGVDWSCEWWWTSSIPAWPLASEWWLVGSSICGKRLSMVFSNVYSYKYQNVISFQSSTTKILCASFVVCRNQSITI